MQEGKHLTCLKHKCCTIEEYIHVVFTKGELGSCQIILNICNTQAFYNYTSFAFTLSF